MTNCRVAACLIAGATFVSAAQADVVVLANRSRSPVSFEIVEGAGPAKPYTINSHQVVTLYVDQAAMIRLPAPAEPREFRLDADSAYFFHDGRAGRKLELEKIDLGDVAADNGDAPPHPVAAQRDNAPRRFRGGRRSARR